MKWSEFERAAPELAEAARARFATTKVALLGTLRHDGWPRISPVEPYLVAGELLFGVMKSAKAADLARDPRCTVHSSVSKADGSEGEIKLFGRAIALSDPAARGADPEAWWMSFHPEAASVYWLDVESALFVRWNFDASTFETLSWSVAGGVQRRVRHYP